jgi:hypothetical protein
MATEFIRAAEAGGASGPYTLLVFAGGVVAAHPLPGLALCAVAGRSPAGGGVVDARVEGLFAQARKQTGVDAATFRGSAETPVDLLLNDDVPELCDPSGIVGGLADWQQRLPGFGPWAATDGVEGDVAVENLRLSRMPLMDGPRERDVSMRAWWNTGGCPGWLGDGIEGFASRSDPRGPSGGLRQEAMPALSVSLGHAHLDAALDANALTRQLGLDPVSLGMAPSGAWVAKEAGSPSRPEHRPDRRFGAEELAAKGASAMAMPQGFGEFLSDRVRSAAQQVGAAGEVAMHCGGSALRPFDPRPLPGLSLAWVVSPADPRYDAPEQDADIDPDPACTMPTLAHTGLDWSRCRRSNSVRGRQSWSPSSGASGAGLRRCLLAPSLAPQRVCSRWHEPATWSRTSPVGRSCQRRSWTGGSSAGTRCGTCIRNRALGNCPRGSSSCRSTAAPHAGAVLDRAEFEAASRVLPGELGRAKV